VCERGRRRRPEDAVALELRNGHEEWRPGPGIRIGVCCRSMLSPVRFPVGEISQMSERLLLKRSSGQRRRRQRVVSGGVWPTRRAARRVIAARFVLYSVRRRRWSVTVLYAPGSPVASGVRECRYEDFSSPISPFIGSGGNSPRTRALRPAKKGRGDRNQRTVVPRIENSAPVAVPADVVEASVGEVRRGP
jgi:hypothetical protein